MTAPADNILRCPNCGGRDIRHTQHSGLVDNLMLLLQRVPFRCRGCQKRFYRRDEWQESPPHADGGSNAERTNSAD